MRHFLQPSISRRTVLALLLGMFAVLVVELAHNYFTLLGASDDGLHAQHRRFVIAMTKVFDQQPDAAGIRAAAETLDLMVAAQYEGSKIKFRLPRIQVWDRTGHRIYASPGSPSTRLSQDLSGEKEVDLNGHHYLLEIQSSPRYVIEHAFETEGMHRVLILDILQDLIVDVAIAFPFVLIPILLGVHGGLKPLRMLSRDITRRHPNDLTPVQTTVHYKELQPLVDSINNLLARLAHKIGTEREFVNDAAHELQTPLAVVASQVHLLATATTPEAREEAHRRSEAAIARAAHQVRQMLDLAALDANAHAANQQVDLARLAREQIAQLEPTARAKGLTLEMESPQLLSVRGAAPAVHSIVQNLLDNAVRYTHEGGWIRVALEHTGSHAALRVQDNGPGIAAEDCERVFDRFYRAPGTASTGTGLGLAIVRQAAEKLGGRACLEPRLEGMGCSFLVILPTAM
ncbi:MAG: hypothetical protein JO142_06425 [Burkholderiales bacterium]|nr:hypothetical protein [Burkholderiales bacterium]